MIEPDVSSNDPFVVADCTSGTCSHYEFLQGTSLASPHAAGVAPSSSRRPATGTAGSATPSTRCRPSASSTAQPAHSRAGPGGAIDYPNRDETWTAVCEGTTSHNGIYGRGIVDALAAAQLRNPAAADAPAQSASAPRAASGGPVGAAYCRSVADPALRRPHRRRRWWRRRALPRSRRALVLGALLAVIILALLLLGVDRTRPGREVPPYDPNVTTSTAPFVPVAPPVITVAPTSTAPATAAPPQPTTTTGR